MLALLDCIGQFKQQQVHLLRTTRLTKSKLPSVQGNVNIDFKINNILVINIHVIIYVRGDCWATKLIEFSHKNSPNYGSYSVSSLLLNIILWPELELTIDYIAIHTTHTPQFQIWILIDHDHVWRLWRPSNFHSHCIDHYDPNILWYKIHNTHACHHIFTSGL